MLSSTLILNQIIILALSLPIEPKVMEFLLSILTALMVSATYWFTQKEKIMIRLSEHAEKHRDIEREFEYLKTKHAKYDADIQELKGNVIESKGDIKMILSSLEYIKQAIDKRS